MIKIVIDDEEEKALSPLAGRRPHLAERLPEAERAPRFREGRLGDGNLRRRFQPATLQIEQQITPRL